MIEVWCLKMDALDVTEREITARVGFEDHGFAGLYYVPFFFFTSLVHCMDC